ncbi:MAG: Na-translocating system protein MpsC family protein [Desulfitobacterium hafniense]|nr:Na-translocating system protein MpsC family protein [Desulfitobacterium hafniense]
MPKYNIHELCRFTTEFLRLKLGKGPKNIKGYSLPGKIILEMYEYLTPLERQVASFNGADKVKSMREHYMECSHDEYIQKVSLILGEEISHCLVVFDVVRDEAFFILVLGQKKGDDEVS